MMSKLSLIAEANAVLAAGNVTVAETRITAEDTIILDRFTDGGTPGALFVEAVIVGTSFDISSEDAADTSTIRWRIYRPTQGI